MSVTQNKAEKKCASGSYGIVKRGCVGALAVGADLGSILGASAYEQSKETGGGGGFTLTPEGETEGTDVSTADAEDDTSAAASALQTSHGYFCGIPHQTATHCILVAAAGTIPGLPGNNPVPAAHGGPDAAAACCIFGRTADPKCQWENNETDDCREKIAETAESIRKAVRKEFPTPPNEGTPVNRQQRWGPRLIAASP